MPDLKFDPAAWITLAAPLMGLTIDPAWQPGVVANLQRMADVATAVMSFPLADDEESGPVFRP